MPPLSAPLRFLLTAPAFGVAAALLLVWVGPDAFDSRWSPHLLAITHLITVGFLAMTMIGALIQILPVIAGIEVKRPLVSAAAIHALMVAGTGILAAGFWIGSAHLQQTAAAVLLAAFAVAIVMIGSGLLRSYAVHTFLPAARLALVSLAATVSLGVFMATALARGHAMNLPLLADLHLQWGMIGWVGLLVAAVAVQVVPMFQTTPQYSNARVRWLAGIVFGALVVLTFAVIGNPAAASLRLGALACLVLAAAGFAAYTLQLQIRRRRRMPDATTFLWMTGMICAIVCALLWSGAQAWPPLHDSRSYALLLGVLMVLGFGVSVINGMLYKIVPFLLWMRMQEKTRLPASVPNVKRILPEPFQRAQARLHVVALVLLATAAVWPANLARPAGLACALSFVLLEWNLLRALRAFHNFPAPVDGMRSAATG